MAKRSKSFDEAIADAEKILRMWDENPSFTLGDITREVFTARLEALRQQRAATEALRTQLTEAVNNLNAKAVDLIGLTTRVLSGVRAVYGPNSTQYEQAGGTRTDDRKTVKKKKS
jgi:hypothetical protein